jgi:hypothetical protein
MATMRCSPSALGLGALAILVAAGLQASPPHVWEGTVFGGVAGEWAGNDLLGAAIAADGDTLVVGAFSDEIELVPGHGEANNVGSVYVFRRLQDQWQFEQRLIAPDAQSGALFGVSVDVSADRIVVGARDHDAALSPGGPVCSDIGAAYVYRRDQGQWQHEATLLPTLAACGLAQSGWSVAIDGALIAIGVPGAADGRAEVWALNGMLWQHQATLVRPPATGFGGPNALGRAIDLSGGRLLVGAPLEDNPPFTQADAGAAYVFESAGGVWSYAARLVPQTPTPAAAFGSAVALSGDRALVGAPDEPEGATSSAGAVHVFARPQNATWLQQQRVHSNMPGPGARFGNSAAVLGARLVVGEYWSPSGATQTGRAHLFVDQGQGFVWQQAVDAPAQTRQAGNAFGQAVAIGTDRIYVGEPGYDGASFNAGAAHVFVNDAQFVFSDGFE